MRTDHLLARSRLCLMLRIQICQSDINISVPTADELGGSHSQDRARDRQHEDVRCA